MRLWVFQTGEYLPEIHPKNRPMRASSLVSAAREKGHQVSLWTADFIHHDLSPLHGRNTKISIDDSFDIRLVRSPGYRRNIGPGRLYDHAILAANLRRALAGEEPPDVAFIGFPPVEAAAVMVEWCAKRGVPTILDVKDQWPETLLRPVPSRLRPAAKPVLYPYYRMARAAIRQSTSVASISDPFLSWALEFGGRDRSENDLVLPLTAPSHGPGPDQVEQACRWWDERGVLDDGRPRVVYAGRLTSVLDLDSVFAASLASPDWQFVISGSGPLYEEVETQSARLPNVIATGWLDHAELSVLYSRGSVALVPYRDEDAFTLSLPNKVYDAFANGLAVATSLSGLLPDVLHRYQVGAEYGPERPLEQLLKEWVSDPDELGRLSANARHLYETEYSHEVVYGGLVDRLESLANAKKTGK